MKKFKEFINESVEATAGVGLGKDNYRFKVSDLIKHAESKNEKGEDNYTVQHMNPKNLADNITARTSDSETKASERKRVKKAEVKYPIIATHRDDGSLHVLDGTHRLQAAIEGNHENIPVRVIPRKHLERYKV